MVSTLLSIFWRPPPLSAWDDVAWTSVSARGVRLHESDSASLEVGHELRRDP